MYKTYLSTLKAGTYTAELTFEDGSKAAIGLAVSNSAQSAVSPSQITFDKYEQSANYADQTVNVVLPAGTRLDSIKIGSTVLERGTDYTYNATNGTIRLLKETLAKKSKGTYMVTFVPNQGSSFTCSLSVVDTAPVNEVVPGTVDFDANTSSGGYADLVVTLNMVDGAALKNIRSNGKTLEENWQYKIKGSKVTINKSAVAEFGKSGASYADFVFVMSKGQSPTLRVNYVTTYALTASVVDDLGLPISGASVTFTPSDAESGTGSADADHRLGRHGNRLCQARLVRCNGNAFALYRGGYADGQNLCRPHGQADRRDSRECTAGCHQRVRRTAVWCGCHGRRQEHHHRHGRHGVVQPQARQLCGAGGVHWLLRTERTAFRNRFDS